MQPEIITEQETKFIINREFKAPRDLVFKAWTEAESLAIWWGPKGFVTKVLNFDFRPGGIFHYKMTNDSGFTMWGKFYYREIIVPERIVFINTFSDEAGTIAKAPFFNGVWPLEVMNTVTFTESDGVTTILFEARPYNATEEEMKRFGIEIPSMNKGFGNSFTQLEEYLAKGGK